MLPMIFLSALTAVIGFDVGLINEGVLNLVLVAFWLYALPLVFSSIVTMCSDSMLVELGKTLQSRKGKRWKRILNQCSLIGLTCLFAYYGYWITMVLAISIYFWVALVAHLAKEKVKPDTDKGE